MTARARTLETFYEPAGLAGLACARACAGHVLIGTVGGREPLRAPVCWGAPFGARRATAADVRASDSNLRVRVVGIGMAVAWDDVAAQVVTAPSGPVGLYIADGPGVRVWATHAVAAAYLARGVADLDVDAIPELVAFDFVGSTRTTIKGALPAPPATRTELTARGVSAHCYWPAEERWAPVPEEDAYAHTETALLDSLDRRVGSKKVALALTAGADSRVLAVGLNELEKSTSAFCWGERGWLDVEGARAVADELGIAFAHGVAWLPDAELGPIFDGEARWSDGRLILAPSRREWPEAADAITLGAAGEVGRAFYYRGHANGREPGDLDGLAELLRAEGRLPGAASEAHATANASVAAWVERASESGLTGWRVLDVLYAEQRVSCWGRIQVPALDAAFVAGFAPQEVVRGLASLSLVDRTTDGFHRRFVASHRPALALPAPVERREHGGGLRHRLRRIRTAPAPAGPQNATSDPLLLDIWKQRPATRAWVADEVLSSPLVTETLGAPWAESVREGFLAGHRRAWDRAAVACAPVALASALSELPRAP